MLRRARTIDDQHGFREAVGSTLQLGDDEVKVPRRRGLADNAAHNEVVGSRNRDSVRTGDDSGSMVPFVWQGASIRARDQRKSHGSDHEREAKRNIAQTRCTTRAASVGHSVVGSQVCGLLHVCGDEELE